MFFVPSIRLCNPGLVFARCTVASIDRSRMSFTRVDLPDPDTPVTPTRQPSGKRDVDVAQVVLASPADDQVLAGPGSPLVGDRDRALTRQVLAGQRFLRGRASPATSPE